MKIGVLRRTLGMKTEELAWGWGKLHAEWLRDDCSEGDQVKMEGMGHSN